MKTEIRTPDPADQPHEFVARTAFPGGDTSCKVCLRGSGHSIHDVPPAERANWWEVPHVYTPWIEDGMADGRCEVCGCREDDGKRHIAPEPAPDMVNHPPHYTAHPSGVEVIQITEHLNFCLGNVVKYVLRADLKGDAVADLEKAAWYLAREIARRKAE